MIQKFFSSLGLLLILSLLSFLLVLGGDKRPAPAVTAPQEAKGYISSQDVSLLAAHIGVSVPCLSPNGHGQVEDLPFAGGYAQLLSFTDENGVTIRCIRPAAAAALLRDDALSPTGASCLIDGMTAMLFAGDNRCALYFGSDDAAYSLTKSGQPEEMLSLVSVLRFTQ